MSRLPAPVLLLLLLSCSAPAYLVTDAPFRQAFPEVTAAWRSLPFWSGAREADLAAGGPGLTALLQSLPPGSAVLVGAAAAQTERSEAGPAVRFFGPELGGSRSLTVRRAEAWSAVARAAAGPEARSWILFPADAREEERRQVLEAWQTRALTPAETAVWPAAGAVPPPPVVLIDFAGPEADQLLLGAAAGRPVHGDPGGPQVPGAEALVWSLKKEGLGEVLLRAARNSSENTEFLPLETAPARR